MKRFNVLACAGLLAAAMAAPSFAADLGPRPSYKAAPPVFVAPVFTWTGFYVGLNGGYGWGNSDWDPGTPKFGTSGWLIGGTLGYNVQMGNFVAGIEGDIDYSTIKGSHGCGGGVCETRNTWLATARGRLGYAFDRFMPYFTGGAAFGDVKMDPPGAGSESDTRFGWTLGGGVEWAFLANWSAKVEYLYVDLGKAHCDATTCGVGTNVSFTSNIVRGGVNYRF